MSRRDYNRSKNEDLGCFLVLILIVVVLIWFFF